MRYSVLLVLDFSQLRNVTLNDETLMREVVGALVSDASQQIGELSRAVQRGDAESCVKMAHNWHGACANVGAASMAALFSSIEREAANGNLRGCHSYLDELTVELEKLRSEAELI